MASPTNLPNTVLADVNFDKSGRQKFSRGELPLETEMFFAKEAEHRLKTTVLLLHKLVSELSPEAAAILISETKSLVREAKR